MHIAFVVSEKQKLQFEAANLKSEICLYEYKLIITALYWCTSQRN
jgi:hypothetical protein